MIIDCKDCSKCCEDIWLPLAVTPNEDIKRWIELHDIEVKGNKARIKNKCSKLKDGRCSIYEDRPNNCREFIC